MGEMVALVADQSTPVDPRDILDLDAGRNSGCSMGVAVYQGRAATVWRHASGLELPGLGRFGEGTALLGASQCASTEQADFSLADIAPFERELFGRLWTFVGSEVLHGLENESGSRFRPLGTSGGERAFCMLLDALWDVLPFGGEIRDPSKVIARLKRRIRAIKKYGAFDFLMNDGEIVIAHSESAFYYKPTIQDGVKLLSVSTQAPIDQTDWVCLLPGTVALLNVEGVLEQSGLDIEDVTPSDPGDEWGLGEGGIDYNCG